LNNKCTDLEIFFKIRESFEDKLEYLFKPRLKVHHIYSIQDVISQKRISYRPILLAYNKKNFDLIRNISKKASRRSNILHFNLTLLLTIGKRSHINMNKFDTEWRDLNKESAMKKILKPMKYIENSKK
jgi:hypothetical protein